MKTYYLHTIDQQPAFFDGTTICFVGRRPGVLCLSLAQIRREQKLSRIYRGQHKFEPMAYGYVRVTLPTRT